MYKIAQVDLGSLTKVPENYINEDIAPEQIVNQDTTTENISFSESNNDKEPTCACTTIDSEIEQETNQIENINSELENDIQNPENNWSLNLQKYINVQPKQNNLT